MNLWPVCRFVCYAHGAVAGAMLVAAAVAWIDVGFTGAPGSPTSYLFGAFIAAVFGALSWAFGYKQPSRPSVRMGLRELMLGLLIFWAVVPVAAAVPFLADGYTLVEAWFEAVSAVTTTGGWIDDNAARAAPAGMIYRASLQWLGGLVSLATAAAVFVRPEFIGMAPRVPPFARGERGSYLRALERGIRAFLPAYAFLTLIGTIGLLGGGLPLADAATMAMSLIASGGLVPHPGGLGAYAPGVIFVASCLMAISAINFIVVAAIGLGRGATYDGKPDPETRAFLGLVPLIAALLWFALPSPEVGAYPDQLLNALSLLSTNGVLLQPFPALTPVLVTAIIGGAAVSTAGGIKLLRWLITFRRATEEVWKLIHPGAVVGSPASLNELGVWIHTLAFAVLLAVFVLTTAFFNFTLETSAAAAVAIISNTGPLIQLAPEFALSSDYGVFGPVLQLIFGAGMVAGRLELVVLLIVVNRYFWQG